MQEIQLYDGGTKANPRPYFPVGYIYQSLTNTSPASLFGGSWTPINDIFLYCADSNYGTVGTDGEATHTLTINEMASHRHPIPNNGSVATPYNYAESYASYSAVRYPATNDTNWGNQPHNNMPPYITVYMWRKTAN